MSVMSPIFECLKFDQLDVELGNNSESDYDADADADEAIGDIINHH